MDLHVALLREGAPVEEFELRLGSELTIGSSPTAGITVPGFPWREVPLLRPVAGGVQLHPAPGMDARVDGRPVPGPAIVPSLSDAEIAVGGVTVMFRVDGRLAVPFTEPEPEEDEAIPAPPSRWPAWVAIAALGLAGAIAGGSAAAWAIAESEPVDVTAPIAELSPGTLVQPTRSTHKARARKPRPDPVARVVKDNAAELGYCSAGSTASEGELSLVWVVADGRVLDAAVIANSTGDDVLAACVARRAARWTFPPGTTGTVGPYALAI